MINAITFSAGIYIVLAGVRMLIAEIIPAFKGISEKLVPNAKPALDCPILFPYAPNAVLIGFFCSFIGGIVGLGVLALLGNVGLAVAIILPGAVVHFFCGASAGVCGNATGGLKGCRFFYSWNCSDFPCSRTSAGAWILWICKYYVLRCRFYHRRYYLRKPCKSAEYNYYVRSDRGTVCSADPV